MKIVWVEPTDRFDVVSVSNEIVDGDALPLGAAYTCGRCGTKLGFDKHTLEMRAARRTTNLPLIVATEIGSAANLRGYGSESFLDWNCPGCGLSARAYIRIWAGGRHGDSGADIVAVAEERA